MSLIHDALKKAQDTEKAPVGSGLASFQESLEPSKLPQLKRMIIIVVGLILAVSVFLYIKFGSKKSEIKPKELISNTATSSKAGADASQKDSEGDAVRLKKNATDAYVADDLEKAWTSLLAASGMDDKDPEIWNNLGLVARKRGDLTKARESYEKALELKSDYPEALNNLAVLSMQSGDVDRAKQLLEKALAISDSYPEANFHMGLLYEQKGDKVKAVEYYGKFLQASGKFPSNITDQIRDHVVEIEK